jgi:membrane-associated phospholipid phosphatase
MPEKAGQQTVDKIQAVVQDAAHAETAPAPVRRYRAVAFRLALILVAGAFALLTFLVRTTPFFSVDLAITRGVQSFQAPFFRGLMTAVSWLGFVPESVILTVLVALAVYGFGLHWEALMTVVAAVFSTAINVLAKDLVQRPRPALDLVNVFATLTSYSFPSGHVMFFLGFFGFIGFLVFSLLKPSIKRTLFLVLVGALVSLVGVSRIYLGAHWASDVLGSYLLGSLTLVAIIQFYLWGKTRFFVHQPVAAEESARK